MKNLFIFLSLLLLPTFALADCTNCCLDLHCRFPFPWKEWVIICGTCIGGCWWFCRRCKCTCTGGSCDLTPVLTAIADLKTEVLAVKADLAAVKGDVLGVKTDVAAVLAAVDDVNRTAYLVEHEL